MRIVLATVLALSSLSSVADARCRQPGSYPGVIRANSTQERSFYLYPRRAKISTITTSVKDKLSFVVKRGGRIICRSGPPSALSDCDLSNIGREGTRYIFVHNRSNRAIEYNLECRD